MTIITAILYELFRTFIAVIGTLFAMGYFVAMVFCIANILGFLQ